MDSASVKNSTPPRITRRQALRLAAGGALCAWPIALAGAQDGPATASSPASAPAAPPEPPWWMGDEATARVVEIRSARSARAGNIDRTRLREMLEEGLVALTGESDPVQAWRAVLKDAERPCIKFNSVGADVLRTNEPMADALLDSLEPAGYGADSIWTVEAPALLVQKRAVANPPAGWGETIEVEGLVQPLANWLLESDAIINVGFLKSHRIAGMSAAMKNISHSVIRSPARHHANRCSPAVAQVIGAAAVSRRLRLSIVNALRIVPDRGPEASESDVSWWGGLLLGQDPVALDAVGHMALEAERHRLGLPSKLEVDYVRAAESMGVGRIRPESVVRLDRER